MNKQRGLLSKTLIFLIIILFIGLTIEPSLSADNFTKNKSIKVTSELYGFGTKNKVDLSLKEIKELVILIEVLHNRLNFVESGEEAIEIFKLGIKELYKYGLFGDMSIQKVQRLTIGRYQRLIDSHQSLDNNENKFCLTIGKTSKTIIDGIPFRFFALVAEKTNSNLFLIFLVPIIMITDFIDDYRPILLDALIYWGAPNEGWGGNGWVWTLGINGIKSWNGSIIGGIKTMSTFYTGIVGFCGINIMINSSEETNFFLGFARHVKINYINFMNDF
ncbi:MAG: hypothetical protein AYK22_07480 [Thermoplasmatales archaeon SG8-52-3]|nr:MAG: hypothetical protein AYK22_07480 [Thermoplasmatales archaeon SG8-52-3]